MEFKHSVSFIKVFWLDRERIFEHRIWQQIEINEMQFAFMKGKGTTDAIFIVRQMQENFRVKGKKLYFGFVDM